MCTGFKIVFWHYSPLTPSTKKIPFTTFSSTTGIAWDIKKLKKMVWCSFIFRMFCWRILPKLRFSILRAYENSLPCCKHFSCCNMRGNFKAVWPCICRSYLIVMNFIWEVQFMKLWQNLPQKILNKIGIFLCGALWKKI